MAIPHQVAGVGNGIDHAVVAGEDVFGPPASTDLFAFRKRPLEAAVAMSGVTKPLQLVVISYHIDGLSGMDGRSREALASPAYAYAS